MNFECQDSQGKKYTIYIFEMRKSRCSKCRCGTNLRDSTGRPVNRIEKGIYEMMDGTELFSDDPMAQ